MLQQPVKNMLIRKRILPGLFLLMSFMIFYLFYSLYANPTANAKEHAARSNSKGKMSLSYTRRTLAINKVNSTTRVLSNTGKLLSKSTLRNESPKSGGVMSKAISDSEATTIASTPKTTPTITGKGNNSTVSNSSSSTHVPVTEKTQTPSKSSNLPSTQKLTNWPKDSFCYKFLENTFNTSIQMCSNTPNNSDSIKCYGSSYSDHMATCTLQNIAVQLPILAKGMYHPDAVSFRFDKSVVLLQDLPTTCDKPTTKVFKTKVEDGDYVYKLLKKVIETAPAEPSVCERWINETVYFYTAHPRHIYFRFLDMYNLHKLILSNNEQPGNFKILRISTSDNYHFAEFDKQAFPELEHISKLPDVRTCFRKVILVPKSYASVLFQCKMHWSLKKDCLNCDGIGMTESTFQTFRKRILRACSLNDDQTRSNSSLVLISRKQYLRDPDDSPEKFERLLSNEDELVSSLQKKYPSANVSAVHFESLPICDQIRLANEANVLLGVHGAGLVHLWWLRDDAMAYEMEPYFEVGNPSFKVLSKIAGRRYFSDYIGGGWQKVNAEINGILKALDAHAKVP